MSCHLLKRNGGGREPRLMSHRTVSNWKAGDGAGKRRRRQRRLLSRVQILECVQTGDASNFQCRAGNIQWKWASMRSILYIKAHAIARARIQTAQRQPSLAPQAKLSRGRVLARIGRQSYISVTRTTQHPRSHAATRHDSLDTRACRSRTGRRSTPARMACLCATRRARCGRKVTQGRPDACGAGGTARACRGREARGTHAWWSRSRSRRRSSSSSSSSSVRVKRSALRQRAAAGVQTEEHRT